MKVTFLGTAAAEGIPSPFCDCFVCEHAREHKGQHIRKRQSVLINDDLLIDMGPDLFASCAQLGLSLTKLNYALITHSHGDHFQPFNLQMRAKGFRLATELPQLTFVAPPSVLTLWDHSGSGDAAAQIRRIPFLPNRSVSLPPYRVNSIEASHNEGIGDAMNYVIDDGNRRLLYASDTGLYREHVWETLKPFRFDAVIVECTIGVRKSSRMHMCIDDMKIMLRNLRELGCINDRTQVVATHFSHQQLEPLEAIARYLHEFGVQCAYDGMILEV
jgi:L-ascorbate metabolism protein UlaG (beta-lactamase superfamily)